MPHVRVVLGPPGTGKTTYLAGQVREYVKQGYKPLINSLTKSAAAEIGSRDIPDHCVGTLHSHCLHSQGMGDNEVYLKHVEDWNTTQPAYSLTVKGKKDVDDPYADDRGDTLGDIYLARYDLWRHRCADLNYLSPGCQKFVTLWEAWKQELQVIDFTDMIQNASSYPPQNADALFVDEAQDFSKLELKKVKEWALNSSALILVGDPRQALYTWRGAYPELFYSEVIKDRTVLSQSYRIPRAVHALAESWAKKLNDYHEVEYHPRDEDGYVGRVDGDYRNPEGLVEFAQRKVEDGKSVMILGSCGYILYKTIGYMRQRGLPFANPWRTKQAAWNPLGARRGTTACERVLSYTRPNGYVYEDPRPWTASEFTQWVEIIDSRGILINGAKKKLKELAASESSLSYTLIDNSYISDLFKPEVQPIIRQLMSESTDLNYMVGWLWDNCMKSKQNVLEYPLKLLASGGKERLLEKPKLYIGTIHSFKGAEADVVIIYPDLSSQGYDSWVGEDHDSVVRLFYVAITRAREEVYICDPAMRLAVDL
jgi:DNA helicase II / ATP-dependent DNA helicase PcrA